jgi:hypothetical protein
MLEKSILDGNCGLLGVRLTGSLDVTDDGTGLVIHEFDADLGDTTARTCKRAELVFVFYREFWRLRWMVDMQGAE